MPTNDTPSAAGATNVLLNQRSLTAPFHRESVGIQGDEHPGKAIGFDQNGVLGAITAGLPSGDVRLFGAICDGIANDTEAIQAAVDAVDVVIFPVGSFKITAPIVVPVGTQKHFVGAGVGKSVLKSYGTFNAVIQIGLLGVDNTAQTERGSFRDFSIVRGDGNVVQYGIYGSRVSHTTFSKIQVQGMFTAGVSTGYGYCINHFDCEYSYNHGDGVFLNEDYAGANNIVNFYGCILFNNDDWGIRIASGNSVHLSGCTIEANQKGGVYAANLRGFSITGSYFEANGINGHTFTSPAVTVKTDIFLNGSTVDTDIGTAYPVSSVLISGNYSSAPYATSFIYASGSKCLSIECNIVNPSTSIALVDPSSACTGAFVQGNENFTTAVTGGNTWEAGGTDQDLKLVASGTGRVLLNSKVIANQNIIANANVGIGAPTPTHLLHVKGDAGTGVKIESTGGYSILEFSNPGGQVMFIPSNGALSIYTGAPTANERIVINSAGQLFMNANDIEFLLTAKGPILRSPGGTRYRIVVADGGALSTTPV